MKNAFLVLLIIFFSWIISCRQVPETAQPPNFIFIIIDDQNMELSAFGRNYIKSPNLDRLASQGVRFSSAYVQQAVCASSRASFLTGLHPGTTGVEYPYSYYFIERIIPQYGTIGQHFMKNGYYTRYFGKVHHGYEESLSAPNYHPGGTRYVSPENIRIDEEFGNQGVPPYEIYDGPDTLFRDGRTAQAVLEALESRDDQKPFFFAVGFTKPHLPFSAPAKYWKLYDEEVIPLPEIRNRPVGFPEIAINRYNLHQYKWQHDQPDSLFTEEYARLLRHAYFACTSFIDAQIGMIMDKVDELGLANNTWLVYVSDHGFHLGEQIHWGKTTLFESSLNSPLIISRKGMENPGSESEALVEYVDILPTLLELAQIELPDHLEGASLNPLLINPDQKFKKAVFSQQERDAIGRRKGFSVRDERYRYTEWRDLENDSIIAIELYDLIEDPLETINMAIDAGNTDVLEKMADLLDQGWSNALPEGVEDLSDNPEAPPAYAWGPEGVPRRKLWHQVYGGDEADGWEKAIQVRSKKK